MSWVDKLKDMALEDDGSAKATSTKKGKDAPAPPPVAAPPAFSNINFAPGAPPAGSVAGQAFVPMGSAGTPPVDPEVLNAVRAQVFAPTINGHVSSFLVFTKAWEKMGKPGQVKQALDVVGAINSDATPAAILGDLDGHLSLLDNQEAQAKATYDRMEREQLGTNDTEVQRLQQSIQAATAEIKRLQDQITAATGQLGTLQASRQQAEQKIAGARATASSAITLIRTELQGMKQLIAQAQ